MDKEKQVRVLKYLLGQAYRCNKHRVQLDARIRGACRIPGIEARILAQKREVEQAAAQVLDILDQLPIHSIERQICELRHIDSKPWGRICTQIPMSRSQVNKRYRAALAMLLENGRIQALIAQHEGEYDRYMHGQAKKGAAGRAEHPGPGAKGSQNSG